MALIVGIVTSLGAFVVNCYFKYRHAKVVEEIARQKKDCALCDRVNPRMIERRTLAKNGRGIRFTDFCPDSA